jgi:hypothetical protein
MILFTGVHGRFQANGFRQFAKRSHLGNNHRFAQAQRAHQRSRVFTNRWIAQVQHNVARRYIAYEFFDGTKAQHAHVRAKFERSYQRIQLQFRMRLAHQNQFCLRLQAYQAAKRPQALGDAFVRFQETKDPDQRRGLVQSQALAIV